MGKDKGRAKEEAEEGEGEKTSRPASFLGA